MKNVFGVLLLMSFTLVFHGCERPVDEAVPRDKSRTNIDTLIQDSSEEIKVVDVIISDNDAQKECQEVVSKMFSKGYRLTAVVPVIATKVGGTGATNTKSLVHYFEKKTVAENTSE